MTPSSQRRTARHVAEVDVGAPLQVRAVVASTDTLHVGSSVSFRVVLSEDEHELDLLFLGRPMIQGFAVGTRCVVHGRGARRIGRLVVWNPGYDLVADDDGPADRVPAPRPAPGQDVSAHLDRPARARRSGAPVPLDQDGPSGLSPACRVEGRPAPDAQVAPAGRFRIYLGPAAGVGKTFAMLDEAHRRQQRGRDVVVGIVETHDRPATAAQLAGLEVVPTKAVEYRGTTFHEMDLDAVLDRHPDIVLVDELAHTNVPGSGRHEKRWQDVQELLAANISVITTVNIQHVESLADVVERIAGISVRERVPDAMVRRADQVELVDSSPEQLRRRMLHGNIYPTERARQALNGFFRTDTLAALRELTLRFLADETDDDLLERLAATAPRCAAWETTERVLVGITASPGADGILRRAARISARLKADLLAVHVRSDDAVPTDAGAIDALHTLADDLGARWIELDGDPASVMMEVAREHQVTQIVVGRSHRSRWQRLLGRGSTVRRLTERAMAAGIDLHVVTQGKPAPGDPDRDS